MAKELHEVKTEKQRRKREGGRKEARKDDFFEANMDL